MLNFHSQINRFARYGRFRIENSFVFEGENVAEPNDLARCHGAQFYGEEAVEAFALWVSPSVEIGPPEWYKELVLGHRRGAK